MTSLNTKQIEAVKSAAGPLKIIASAGSGKTLTLTARIAHFISQGVPSNEMLAITFTRKATNEIRHRIKDMLGWRLAAGLVVSSFHSCCLKILQLHYAALGFQQKFTVLGADEQKELVKECIREWQLREAPKRHSSNSSLEHLTADVAQLTADDEIMNEVLNETADTKQKGRNNKNNEDRLLVYFVNFIRKSKSNNKLPQAFMNEHRFIYQAYLTQLKRRSAIDFNDMIPLTLHLFRRRPGNNLHQLLKNLLLFILDNH